MNAFLWAQHLKDKESPTPTVLDHRYVASYEAGRHWWPSEQYRAAWRHALRVQTDAQLGDLAATERLVVQLGHGDTPPPAHGVWPISWALSRSYLALARLTHRGDDGGPAAALDALQPILTLPDAHRINQLGQVIADIEHHASSPVLATSTPGRALRAAVRSFRKIPTTKALTS
jgi:hypothetical protein